MVEEFFAELPPPDADERIRQLHAYWLTRHPGIGLLPGRQHIDPIDIPALLPWVWLADVQRQPLRFRYRLLGTEQVRAMGRDYTGYWIDDAHPPFLTSAAYRQFAAAAEQGVPGYRSGDTHIVIHKDYRSMERLLLPLAADGKTVNMLLAISVYHKAE